jgi:FMN hydrolase / 5-amino-6-(5-phospho-D-ribitylamino)uracil phosphatase
VQAVTLDLWHTLMFLPPDQEEEYMRTQVRLATEALEAAPLLPDRPHPPNSELAAVFEREYADAVSSAGKGRTVTPAEQLLRAGEATGRAPRVKEYLDQLANVVESLPFVRAPGALEMLDQLATNGYRLGVISNTVGEPGEFLRPILRKMGFNRRVNAFVFSDEHPWTKPSPEIFRWTLGQLGARPDEAVHVGDGWSDIEGARRTGMRAGILFTGLQDYGARYKALFLPDGWDRPDTPYSAARLEEVLGLVRKILPPGSSS